MAFRLQFRHVPLGTAALRLAVALTLAVGPFAASSAAAASSSPGAAGAASAASPAVLSAASTPRLTSVRSAASAASSPRLTLDTDLRSPSGISAWAIDAFLAAHTPLPPLGRAFKAAEARFHVNALYLLAMAMHESGYGRSYLAQHRNNLFGWNAIDRNPIGNASMFVSYADSISYVASQIAKLYLDPSGAYYGGAPTLHGMRRYASDPLWAASIAGIANSLELPSLAGRGLQFTTTLSNDQLTTGDGATLIVRALPANALPDGLRLAGRVRRLADAVSAPPTAPTAPTAPIPPTAFTAPIPPTAPTAPIPPTAPTAPTFATGPNPAAIDRAEFTLTSAQSASGVIRVKIAAGPNPGNYVIDLVVLDSDGASLPLTDAVQIPSLAMNVAPRYDVRFTARSDAGVVLEVANAGTLAVPALGPQVGTLVAGRPQTMLATWIVRPTGLPIDLPRHALPSDLTPGLPWDAIVDLGTNVLQPGDVLVTRLEIPDPPGGSQATAATAFLVDGIAVAPGFDAGSGPAGGPGSGGAPAAVAGPGGAPITLSALADDDLLALAAIGLVAPPPVLGSGLAAGAPVVEGQDSSPNPRN